MVAQKSVVFQAENHHVAQCGIPPEVATRGEPGHYYGYFQNEYGEQWVLDIDVAARRGVLRVEFSAAATWDGRIRLR